MSKKTKQELEPVSAEYREMLDLLAVHSESTNQLAVIQAECNDELLAIMDPRRDQFADLTVAIRDAEVALEAIARQHPEWFGDKKSVKTPYGTVKFHASKVIEADDEKLSVALIEEACQFDYLRQIHVLNIESLEKLTDKQLEQFRLRRVEKKNFSVKPATVDLGKAISTADSEEPTDRTANLIA
ncbi:MAG TPA: host-nuclease inhibitor Gam family protein [Verrucomicrobiae bacterium]|jgi:hypothetical protein